ncbi:hypothetical protein ElyMa_003514700 [Elysia marginata]|uniref:C3H1-type domain-containing protein n=1 Tax=Elysia marginata TaxID=1093978 RepID=A0AAV4EFE5_9GAST|nr:hypothetical protein ElyMa_003514700 [Elysia marginata]
MADSGQASEGNFATAATAAVDGTTNRLSQIRNSTAITTHALRGRGVCQNGTECTYLHALPDGTEVEGNEYDYYGSLDQNAFLLELPSSFADVLQLFVRDMRLVTAERQSSYATCRPEASSTVVDFTRRHSYLRYGTPQEDEAHSGGKPRWLHGPGVCCKTQATYIFYYSLR